MNKDELKKELDLLGVKLDSFCDLIGKSYRTFTGYTKAKELPSYYINTLNLLKKIDKLEKELISKKEENKILKDLIKK